MLDELDQAARAIAEADALLIGGGAGMGVDSGLPDFRGNEGFWNAYPPFREMRLDFVDLANPRWFFNDPHLAWGFYGHRLELYRRTRPHAGFARLLDWSREMKHGAFVYTSNVDGQYQAAGFDRVHECHGSIHHLQCTAVCTREIWASSETLDIDEETCRARDPLPRCPHCGELARPNILMFNDWRWLEDNAARQSAHFHDWLDEVKQHNSRLVIVEAGAGTAIPSVRMTCERTAEGFDATLIRINPREPQVPEGHLSFPAGALDTLEAIQARRSG